MAETRYRDRTPAARGSAHSPGRDAATERGVVTSLPRERLLRTLPWEGPEAPDWAPLVEREWLVTNGLGGYASGTVSGAATRRYHGLLVAAEPPPLGRIITLADLIETVRVPDGREIQIGGDERPEKLELHGARYLKEFRLEWGLPAWTYEIEGITLQKRLALVWGMNATVIEYGLPRGGRVKLALRPVVRFRSHDLQVDAPLEGGYRPEHDPEGLRVAGIGGYPDLRMRTAGVEAPFTPDVRVLPSFLYRVEASRGYAAVGDTWSPGYWTTELREGEEVALVASTAEWDEIPRAEEAAHLFEREMDRRHGLTRVAHPAARDGAAAELVIAADQFIIRPTRAHGSEGEGERSIIAGYHWFTDWGRDTMISLEGLTLLTGRAHEAGAILRTFGSHVKDGLIPNHFLEGGNDAVYHTADATLWFFHAMGRYLQHTDDRDTLDLLMPRLREIVSAHLAGTRFDIGVDPADGLLVQGADGYQLTWMDAKVEDWVVTPRRGKAVEINALWYNALRLMERWEHDAGEVARAGELGALAARVRASFNERFWIEEDGYLYDVVDGEGGKDASFRPNQIFAISLDHPVLEEARWASVAQAVRERLLTPVGLRSLAPGHPDYRNTYFGNLWERDAAYHQGTVWSWLIGPFVDAWLKVRPDDLATARGFLDGLVEHLDEFCIGSVAEIFDAEPPHRPRGCIAQAWGVSELLRGLVRTEVRSGDGADRALQGERLDDLREGS
jgi:predicted glycogen debranching enzyme